MKLGHRMRLSLMACSGVAAVALVLQVAPRQASLEDELSNRTGLGIPKTSDGVETRTEKRPTLPTTEVSESNAERSRSERDDPFARSLTAGDMLRIWAEVRSLPSDDDASLSGFTAWEQVGPWGMRNDGAGGCPDGTTGRMTGRVVDIEVAPGINPRVRVLAATGGLWGFNFGSFLLTETLPNGWFGCLSTNPTNENRILVGTGEVGNFPGTGMWVTDDGGDSWQQVSLLPPSQDPPNFITRIRHSPDGQIVHAATSSGYFRSTDSGSSWNLIRSGFASDLCIHPNDPNRLFMTMVGDGLYGSVNAGQSWAKFTTGGIPVSGMSHGAVSCSKWYPRGQFLFTYLYVSFVGLGVYKSIDSGVTWSQVLGDVSIDYTSAIGQSPTDHDVVLVGGYPTNRRTTDGGLSWSPICEPNFHADGQVIAWAADGTTVWFGHDGGYSVSYDAGANWFTDSNFMPITQFYNIDVCASDERVILGGSQDNGVSYTHDAALEWSLGRLGSTEGDGYGVAVHPTNPNLMWGVNGVPYRRYRSVDGGATWIEANTGIDAGQAEGDLRWANGALFTCSGLYAYKSTNGALSWSKLNPASPFMGNMYRMDVSGTGGTVYGCTDRDINGRLYVYLPAFGWSERSAGLPNGIVRRAVPPRQTDADRPVAWAIMSGTGTNPSGKVFKTYNRGLTWHNRTTNLPDVYLRDIEPHPVDSSIVYLASDFGCFVTVDAGISWRRWDNGMPEGAIVMELVGVGYGTSSETIYAGTLGHSVWKRSASVVTAANPDVTSDFQMLVAKPSIFSKRTQLQFTLPLQGNVKLDIVDARGRRVKSVFEGFRDKGVHALEFEADGLSSGVYFARLEVGMKITTSKLTILK